MEKAPSPSSRGLIFFLKRRYAAECAVLRAARAQNAALVEKNGAAHMRVRGGEVELPSRPTDAGVAGSEFS